MPPSVETILQQQFDLYTYPPDASLLATGVNSVLTVALPASKVANNQCWYIDTVCVSYSAAPTGGILTVYAEATPIFQVDIIAGGPSTVPVFKRGEAGRALSVALSAGGSGITGRLNVNAKVI